MTTPRQIQQLPHEASSRLPPPVVLSGCGHDVAAYRDTYPQSRFRDPSGIYEPLEAHDGFVGGMAHLGVPSGSSRTFRAAAGDPEHQQGEDHHA